MSKISPSIPILSNPISLEEGAASNDIISSSHLFLGLPCLLVPGTISIRMRLGHFHKNAFGKTHVAHSAYMTKPGQL